MVEVDLMNLELFEKISLAHNIAAKSGNEGVFDSIEFKRSVEESLRTLAKSIEVIALVIGAEAWSTPSTYFERCGDHNNDFLLSAKLKGNKSFFEFSFGYVYSPESSFLNIEHYFGWYVEMPLHFSVYINKMTDDFWYKIGTLDFAESVFIPNEKEFGQNPTNRIKCHSVINDIMCTYYSMDQKRRDGLKEDFVIGTIRVYLSHVQTLRELIDDGMHALDQFYTIHGNLAKFRYTSNDQERTFNKRKSSNVNPDNLWSN